jgi:hypothetical protein
MDFTSLDNNKMLENIVEFYSQSTSICSLLLPKLSYQNIIYNLYITIYGSHAIIKIKFDSTNIDKEFMHHIMQLHTTGSSCFTNIYGLDNSQFKLELPQFNSIIDVDDCTIKFFADIPKNELQSHNIITSISFFLMSIQCNLDLLIDSFRNKHNIFIQLKEQMGLPIYHYKKLDEPVPEIDDRKNIQIDRKHKAEHFGNDYEINFNNKKLKQ